ncbi:MAG: UDP-N-acetylmuramoyl-L-alanyl-D-glutamate--2,6-diaminopimelate ligase [Phycisphaerae bacterium]
MNNARSLPRASGASHAGMPLIQLLRCGLGDAWGPAGIPDPLIYNICQDSRQASAGSLFVALRGANARGVAFTADAARRGAVAVLSDRECETPPGVVWVKVPDARIAVSRLAAVFFGLDTVQTAGKLEAIGITGTNGKSTIAYMVRSIFQFVGRPTALLGTIEYDLLSRRLPADLTTPDPVTLIQHMMEAHRAGARVAVLEVSSHSLDQHRTAGLKFSTSVFTNLTQDHLDYHGGFESYLRAKRRLFDGLSPDAVAIVNTDDEASEPILKHCAARVMRFGIENPADVHATILAETSTGCRFRIEYRDDSVTVDSALVGRHNVSNALAAAAVGLAAGIDLKNIGHGLMGLSFVPGRLQRVETHGRGYGVFVDYAHTDDALRNVLRALRPITRGRLWCVFGCGGDRDRTKRPLMARAVAEGADGFVITSDNPRTEDPMSIIEDIHHGLGTKAQRRGIIEPDRARAIAGAIERLSEDDTLLIAGKGHEDYQILGSKRVHFDDVEVAQAAIQRR